MIWVMSLAYLQSTMRGCEISKYQEKNMSVVPKKRGESIEDAAPLAWA
jgi:hypothetical protein